MAKRELPTPEVLRQLLRYDPETGTLYWLKRGPEWFSDCHKGRSALGRWNSRFAGKPALNCVRRGLRHGSLLDKSVTAHKVVWAFVHGVWPTHEIDHINGDATDNRIANLRDVPHGENLRNMSLRSDNSSGFTGVTFFRSSQRWGAQVSINGTTKSLGTFKTRDEAIAARESANAELQFHLNHGRAKTTQLGA